jgi:hypothetical protein
MLTTDEIRGVILSDEGLAAEVGGSATGSGVDPAIRPGRLRQSDTLPGIVIQIDESQVVKSLDADADTIDQAVSLIVISGSMQSAELLASQLEQFLDDIDAWNPRATDRGQVMAVDVLSVAGDTVPEGDGSDEARHAITIKTQWWYVEG